MQRGRPPHDDVLTPREWQVLSLIRQGLTNEQIAERLGISHSGARYHVSEILGKLGVSKREEAAAWQGKMRVHDFGLAVLLGRVARVSAALTMTAVMAGFVLSLAGVGSSSNKQTSRAPEPTRVVKEGEAADTAAPDVTAMAAQARNAAVEASRVSPTLVLREVAYFVQQKAWEFRYTEAVAPSDVVLLRSGEGGWQMSRTTDSALLHGPSDELRLSGVINSPVSLLETPGWDRSLYGEMRLNASGGRRQWALSAPWNPIGPGITGNQAFRCVVPDEPLANIIQQATCGYDP